MDGSLSSIRCPYWFTLTFGAADSSTDSFVVLFLKESVGLVGPAVARDDTVAVVLA